MEISVKELSKVEKKETPEATNTGKNFFKLDTVKQSASKEKMALSKQGPRSNPREPSFTSLSNTYKAFHVPANRGGTV